MPVGSVGLRMRRLRAGLGPVGIDSAFAPSFIHPVDIALREQDVIVHGLIRVLGVLVQELAALETRRQELSAQITPLDAHTSPTKRSPPRTHFLDNEKATAAARKTSTAAPARTRADG